MSIHQFINFESTSYDIRQKKQSTQLPLNDNYTANVSLGSISDIQGDLNRMTEFPMTIIDIVRYILEVAHRNNYCIFK